jgi:hypothetical protein
MLYPRQCDRWALMVRISPRTQISSLSSSIHRAHSVITVAARVETCPRREIRGVAVDGDVRITEESDNIPADMISVDTRAVNS